MTKVFVSYAHENDLLRAQVLELVKYLRANRCQVQCDQDFPDRPPPSGWQIWMHEGIAAAEVVLMVCTPRYHERFQNLAFDSAGRGVRFEGAIITQALYDDGMRNNRKYFPVQPDGGPIDDVPTILRPWLHSHYFPSGNVRIFGLVQGDAIRPLEPPTQHPNVEQTLAVEAQPKLEDLLSQRAKRLIDGTEMPEFVGAWCEGLLKELGAKGLITLDSDMRPKDHRIAVCTLFSRGAAPKNLLIALKKANASAKGKLENTAQRWASELLTLVTLHCVSFSNVSLSRPTARNASATNARVGLFPGNSHLIATVAIASLRGLKVEISSPAQLMPMLTLNTQEDYVETVLRNAYNKSYALERPPAVVEGKLSEEQKGDFRAWLDIRAYDGVSTGMVLILDECPIETRTATAEAVANVLDTLVLNGTAQTNELIHASSGMDASSFHSHLKNLLDDFLTQA